MSTAGAALAPGISQAMELRGAAADLFRLKSREILIEGPAGTGKTTAVCLRALQLAERFPGSRVLLVRKTRASMTQSVLVTLEGFPFERSAVSREHRASYRLAGGSEIVIAGLDNPDRIMSSQYDLICAYESTELNVDDWEKLVTRLRNDVMPWQQAIADCNPSAPSHWLNQRAAAGTMRRLRSSHRDNPALWRDGSWTPMGAEYIRRLEGLTGVRRQRLLEGLWAAAEGLVYPELATATFGSGPDGAGIPEGVARVAAGVDWGFSDPTAVVVGVLGHDGVLRIVEEVYEVGLAIDLLAVRVRQLVEKWKIEALFCDPSRADLIAQLRRLGAPARPNQVRQIETGIAMVQQRLARGLLAVSGACVNLLRESAEYQYALDRGGKPKSVPLDASNHAMDSLRYLVSGIDYGRALGPSAPPAPEREPEKKSRDFWQMAWGE